MQLSFFSFSLDFHILCCVCEMKCCFSGNARTNDTAEDTYPFFESLSRLSFDNLNSAVESNSIILNNDLYMRRLYKSPLRFMPFRVCYHLLLSLWYEAQFWLKFKLLIKLDFNLKFSTFQNGVPCNDTFENCKFRNEKFNCCDHFKIIYSEHGYCFGFNARYIDDDGSEYAIFVTNEKLRLIYIFYSLLLFFPCKLLFFQNKNAKKFFSGIFYPYSTKCSKLIRNGL